MFQMRGNRPATSGFMRFTGICILHSANQEPQLEKFCRSLSALGKRFTRIRLRLTDGGSHHGSHKTASLSAGITWSGSMLFDRITAEIHFCRGVAERANADLSGHAPNSCAPRSQYFRVLP